MELTMTNSLGFCELNEQEMMMVDGGNMGTAMGVFVGVLAISWSPVVAFVCPPAAVGMALGGAGIIGKATGAY